MPTFLLITMIIGILPRIAIFMTTRRSIFSDRQCPPNRFAVVLGAGIEKDGRPTRVLRERIETAVNLLRLNHTEKQMLIQSIEYGKAE